MGPGAGRDCKSQETAAFYALNGQRSPAETIAWGHWAQSELHVRRNPRRAYSLPSSGLARRRVPVGRSQCLNPNPAAFVAQVSEHLSAENLFSSASWNLVEVAEDYPRVCMSARTKAVSRRLSAAGRHTSIYIFSSVSSIGPQTAQRAQRIFDSEVSPSVGSDFACYV